MNRNDNLKLVLLLLLVWQLVTNSSQVFAQAVNQLDDDGYGSEDGRLPKTADFHKMIDPQIGQFSPVDGFVVDKSLVSPMTWLGHNPGRSGINPAAFQTRADWAKITLLDELKPAYPNLHLSALQLDDQLFGRSVSDQRGYITTTTWQISVNQPLFGLEGGIPNVWLIGGLVMALCLIGALILIVVLLIIRRSLTGSNAVRASQISPAYQTPEGYMIHEGAKNRFPTWVLWVGSAGLFICIVIGVIGIGVSQLTPSRASELLGMLGMRAIETITPITTITPTTTTTSMEVLTATETPQALETPLPAPTATETKTPTSTPTAEPTLGIGSTMVNPIDGASMVYVPEGEFLMGSEDEDAAPREKPEHMVYLDAFWVYQHPVTNAQFTAFIDVSDYQTTAEETGWSWVWDGSDWVEKAGAYWGAPEGPGSSVADMGDHPVVQVSWFDAVAYCEWAGGRLPTEAEWEKAARGTDGRKYPWGNSPVTGDKANYCDVNCPIMFAPDARQDDGYARTSPVGSYPAGVSPYGALDIAGNVWEWVADWYAEDYYSSSPYENPTGPTSGDRRVIRGGSWHIVERYLQVFYRQWYEPDETDEYMGFRCLHSTKPPTLGEQPETGMTFDDWLKDVNILVHEDMWGSNEQLVVSSALESLDLDGNTTHVRNTIGDLLSYMESDTTWDLIILALESRSFTYSGEIFDALNDQLERGSSVVLEIWYLDQIASGRIRPLMQNCGIAFQQNWIRQENEDWNRFVVYIWEPDAPVLSDPNVVTFLGPGGTIWQTGDVGDLIRLTPNSNARLLAGLVPNQSDNLGLMAECFDGRMIWQTFSTHNYRQSQTLTLWQNYVINSLKARYDYLQE